MNNVGRVIYGYCNGYFGRNSYDNKRIEAEGPDWIVAREMREDARPEFASFSTIDEKQDMVDDWVKKPDPEDV